MFDYCLYNIFEINGVQEGVAFLDVLPNVGGFRDGAKVEEAFLREGELLLVLSPLSEDLMLLMDLVVMNNFGLHVASPTPPLVPVNVGVH